MYVHQFPSFRDRLLTYTAKHASELHEHFILAETFKDYFKENAYPTFWCLKMI